MANYPIGRLIAEMRSRQGMSQEELAGDICSVSTISKIENGAQMPKRKIYEALLQRLGVTPRNCTAYISEKEMKKYILEAEIEYLMSGGQYDRARKALADYISYRPFTPFSKSKDYLKDLEEHVKQCQRKKEGLTRLEIQFVYYQLAVLAQEEKKDSERALALCGQAVRATMPRLVAGQLPQSRLLSRQEIRIFCRIAELIYEKGEKRQAKSLLFYLKDCIEMRQTDPEEGFYTYPEIMCLLSRWMGDDGRYDQQLELCNRGLDLCIAQLKQSMLPGLLEVKGCALAARMQQKQAESILKQAYFVYCAIGESADAERLKVKARDLFQIDLGSGS